MLKFKRRKLAVEKMRVDAVSWVEQGAVPGDNVLVIQGEGEEETTDVAAVLQGYAERFAATDDEAEQYKTLADLNFEIGTAIRPVTQAANFMAELNESRARYPWDLWSAFTSALYECESPADAEALVDQFAAQLKVELTAPGDGDGDEAPYQNEPTAQSGDQGATMQNGDKTAPGTEEQTAPVSQEAGTEAQTPITAENLKTVVLAVVQELGLKPAVETTVEQGEASTDANAETETTEPVEQGSETSTETGQSTEQVAQSIWAGVGLNVPTMPKLNTAPVAQANGTTSQDGVKQNADGTITLTVDALRDLMTAAVKQGVNQATGRPRPVSQQGEETGSDGRAVAQSAGSVWDGGPFDAIAR